MSKTHRPRRRRAGPLLVVALAAFVATGALVPLARPALAVDTADFGDLDSAPRSPVVGFVARPQGDGYWLTTAAGNVYHFGAAPWRGSMAGTRLRAPIVGIAAMPDGNGYYLFGRNGSVYHFGSARFRGSAASLGLVSPVTAMAVTHTGLGYWLVTANGRVIPFGDAPYHGRARPPVGVEVSGIDSTSSDAGYWIGLSTGRVVARGGAIHRGDSGGRVPARAVALVATSDDGGYWTPLADGRMLNYGGAASRGGLHGGRFDGRVVGFDRRPDDLGYWIATTVGRVFPEPGTELPPAGVPTLSVTPVVTGLTIPWDLGFLPGGAMVFSQRGGTINAFVDGSVRTLAEPNDVVASGEGGVLGLAVDPDFAANRRIYVCFMSSVPAGGDDVRVVRYRVNGALTDLTERTDIVTGLPVNTTGSLGRHSGCRPRFGPDGFLWVGTGDAATGTTPQDNGSLGGKVLRVDSDGNAAPGNPGGHRWYTKGHRNVQGLAFQPGSGRAYSVEHGPDRDDEINRLVNGGNYGWNPVPGYNESVPMTDLDEFPGARVAAWSSGSPTLATSGAAFLEGDQWRDWDGALAVATLKDETLRIFRVSADGSTVRQIAVRFAGVYGRLRSAVLSPSGMLFLTTSNGGGTDQILRVRAS
jgi:glucose/arabinose dehydrogenase